MSPAINILMTPPLKVKFETSFSVTLSQTKFLRNSNVQVLALGPDQTYSGSLIQMRNLAKNDPANN